MDSLAGRVTRLRERAQQDRLRQVGEQLSPGVCFPVPRSQSVGSNCITDLSTEFVIEAVLSEVLTMAMSMSEASQPQTKLRLCHQCHTPLNADEHSGMPSGLGKCSLEHWHGCKGDIEGGKGKHGKDWAGCPTTQNSETEDETEEEGDLDNTLDEGLKVAAKLPPTVEQAAAILEEGLNGDFQLQQSLSQQLHSNRKDTEDFDDSSSSEDEELHLQQLEFEKLQKLVELQALANKDLEKVRKKEAKKLRDAQEKETLAQKMKLLKEKQASLLLESQASSSSSAPKSTRTKGKILKDKVAEYEAKKARKAAAKLAEQQKKIGDDLQMSGIRSLPDVRLEVEEYMTRLKAAAPTLASDPTATGYTSNTFQPEGVLVRGHSVDKSQALSTPKQKYVYVAELGQAIPIVDSVNDIPTARKTKARPTPVTTADESECSSDDDCPFEPEPGMRLAWKKHNDGRKYFKVVPAHDESPEMVISYQLDRSSGNYERVLVDPHGKETSKAIKSGRSTTKVSGNAKASPSPVFKDFRVSSSRAARVPVRKQELQASFVTGDTDKQGKETRLPSLGSMLGIVLLAGQAR